MILLIIVDGVHAVTLHGHIKKLKALKFLFAKGAYTFRSKISYPGITEPQIASLLHGIEPPFLGDAYWSTNAKYGDYKDYPETVSSIFKVLHEHKHQSAVVGTWKDFSGVVDMKYTDNLTSRVAAKNLDLTTAEKTVEAIKSGKYSLVVSYYEAVDHAAHDYGIGPKYIEALEQVDAWLVTVLKSVKTTDTVIFVTDHGRDAKGKGKEHSNYCASTNTVPFCIMGPKIVKGPIKDMISNTDVAPTIAALLVGKKNIPRAFRGRVMDVFG